MNRLGMALFSMISTILASVGVVVALVSGFDGLFQILGAALAGFVLAVPITWYVTREMTKH